MSTAAAASSAVPRVAAKGQHRAASLARRTRMRLSLGFVDTGRPTPLAGVARLGVFGPGVPVSLPAPTVAADPSASTDPTVSPPPASASPAVGEPSAAGLVPLTLPDGRSVWLRLPARAETQPHRLLLVLHGWHLTPGAAQHDTGLSAAADKGLIVAYGAGLAGSWNAGTCCGLAVQRHVDDVGYVAEAIRGIEAAFPVATSDVVVVGFSNGGMLAAEAACDLPDLIHAAATVSGPLLTACPHAVRLLHVHGLADTTVPLTGGYSSYTKSWFPDVRLEARRLPRGSHYALVLWRGGHAWPTAAQGVATDRLILRLF